ncbi:hypothetical protein BB558_004095 [Smittium angustum]|uniref:Squalene synthase n=1 Tax=Smittium angustum TaxID=133377 RepID=A0A2U1J4I4_SMIAN|nr:hypothetical protein BB558_004095 [Smittium angustum]
MSKDISNFLNWVSHPEELISSILYLTKHSTPVEKTNKMKGVGEMKRCYTFLEETSRSFAAVIQEIHPEIPGPDEKDAHLLMEFHIVISQFLKMNKAYQDIIADITKKMGAGMNIYLEKRVNSVADYEEYCYYVAGLVGIGLSKLFSASGLEDHALEKMENISNSMGLFLQKTNIIRDVNEDVLDNRRFWPTEIWSKHVNYINDLVLNKNVENATYCLNEMCLNALHHIPDIIEYLSSLRDPTIFNFCAIPQAMAIATIARCFNNQLVLDENVKIRKGEAIRLIYEATNINNVQKIIIRYLDEMHKKALTAKNDPNQKQLISKITTLRTNIYARTKFGPLDYLTKTGFLTILLFVFYYFGSTFYMNLGKSKISKP